MEIAVAAALAAVTIGGIVAHFLTGIRSYTVRAYHNLKAAHVRERG